MSCHLNVNIQTHFSMKEHATGLARNLEMIYL